MARRRWASPLCRSSAWRLHAVAVHDAVADGLGVTPMQVALAWLLQRAPNILLIPDTSSIGHLRENLVAHISLGRASVVVLDQIAAGERVLH